MIAVGLGEGEVLPILSKIQNGTVLLSLLASTAPLVPQFQAMNRQSTSSRRTSMKQLSSTESFRSIQRIIPTT